MVDQDKTTIPVESVNEEKNGSNKKQTAVSENTKYLESKEQNHANIIDLIKSAEEELADLRLRKQLMEADFSELLSIYSAYLLERRFISTIAKSDLAEYFTYEILKPLNPIGLKLSEHSYDTWETRHFTISYSFDGNHNMNLAFRLPPINTSVTSEDMSILRISPKTMTVEVDDQVILQLIQRWSIDRYYSSGQLTIFNHELNQILRRLRELGFTIQPTLIDATIPLDMSYETNTPLNGSILDDTFIVTMENQAYDFEKIAADQFEVLLDKGQSVMITGLSNQKTKLDISSGDYSRSIIDFLISYEFLVPIAVRRK